MRYKVKVYLKLKWYKNKVKKEMIINMIKLLKKEEKIKYNNLSKLLKIKRRSIKRIN